MNTTNAVQFVNEIENQVREAYGLYKEGFVIVFYMKKMNVIGFKVIDEGKQYINVDNDEFAYIDKHGEIKSQHSKILQKLILEFSDLNLNDFSSLAIQDKTQFLLQVIKSAYLLHAHIPIKLLGIN